MDHEILLEHEKNKCKKELLRLHKKYETDEIKKIKELYNYLLEKQNNELDPNIKKRLDEDINILLNYL
jgi:hypothetical protein